MHFRRCLWVPKRGLGAPVSELSEELATPAAHRFRYRRLERRGGVPWLVQVQGMRMAEAPIDIDTLGSIRHLIGSILPFSSTSQYIGIRCSFDLRDGAQPVFHCPRQEPDICNHMETVFFVCVYFFVEGMVLGIEDQIICVQFPKRGPIRLEVPSPLVTTPAGTSCSTR